MQVNKENIITKIHLFISIVIVFPISIIYAFKPEIFFNISLNTLDEYNLFKAVMGLYIAFSVLWCIGLFYKSYLKVALLSNIVFMLGLAFGRLVSIIFDGSPSLGFFLGMIGEFFIGFYGFWVISNKKLNFAKN